jgi:hypothetical protein
MLWPKLSIFIGHTAPDDSIRKLDLFFQEVEGYMTYITSNTLVRIDPCISAERGSVQQ